MIGPVECEHDHAPVAAEPNQHSHQEPVESERSDNRMIIIIITVTNIINVTIIVIITVTIITWERLCTVE